MIKRDDYLTYLVQISTAGLGLALIICCLMLSNRGVDLTDEGYYFNWISNPWLYKYYASQFGYIYHPIYKALGNSIVHLRQANMLISFGLSWLLSYVVIKQYFQDTSKASRLLLTACLALPSLYILMIVGHWVPTPSYNSLNFQGCLMAALGFVYSLKPERKYQQLAMLFIGVGGWLVFMAKPSTALLLAVVAVLFYLPSIKKDWRILIGAAITAMLMLLFSAWMIDGSMLQFIKRYQGGLLLMHTMASGHGVDNLLRLDWFKTTPLFKLQFAATTALLMLGFKLASAKSPIALAILKVLMLLAVAIAANQLFFSTNIAEKSASNYHTLIILAVLVAAFLYTILSSNKNNDAKYGNAKLFYLLLVLPYLYAAGTGNNYWQTAAGASVFWVLATVLLAEKHHNKSTAMHVIAVFCLVSVAFGLKHAIQSPYRQSQSILTQTASFKDPHSQATLMLAEETAKYINALTSAANAGGFTSGTPVIDLTGHHPGSAYFLKSNAIGQSWMIGGYAGSYPLAKLALYQASCEEIANAWLLIEKNGRRSISDNVLVEHGLQPSKQTYQVVGQFDTQQLSDWGSKNPQHPEGIYRHYLAKPIDVNKQTQACLAYRKLHPSPFK